MYAGFHFWSVMQLVIYLYTKTEDERTRALKLSRIYTIPRWTGSAVHVFFAEFHCCLYMIRQSRAAMTRALFLTMQLTVLFRSFWLFLFQPSFLPVLLFALSMPTPRAYTEPVLLQPTNVYQMVFMHSMPLTCRLTREWSLYIHVLVFSSYVLQPKRRLSLHWRVQHQTATRIQCFAEWSALYECKKFVVRLNDEVFSPLQQLRDLAKQFFGDILYVGRNIQHSLN